MKIIRLTESNLHDIILKTAYNILTETKVSALRKYNQDIDDDTFYQLISADPTYNPNNKEKSGKYAKWLLSLYHKDNSMLERLEEISNSLKLYNPNLQPDRATIDSVSDDTELKQRIDALNGNTEDRNKKQEYSNDIVYEDTDWMIIIPSTYQSSKYWGQGTHWCTASNNQFYFDHYNEQGFNLYINIDKSNGEKYQFCFESDEFMNKDDENISKFKNDIPNIIHMPNNVRLWYAKYTDCKKFAPIEDLPKFLNSRQDVYHTFNDTYGTNIPHLFRVTYYGYRNIIDIKNHKYLFNRWIKNGTFSNFYDGICKVSMGENRHFFINQFGKRVISQLFIDATDFENGISIVTLPNKSKNILLTNGSYLFSQPPSSINVNEHAIIANFDNTSKIVLDKYTLDTLYKTNNPNEIVMDIKLNKDLFPILSELNTDVIALILNNEEGYAAFITNDGRFLSPHLDTTQALNSPKEGKAKKQ